MICLKENICLIEINFYLNLSFTQIIQYYRFIDFIKQIESKRNQNKQESKKQAIEPQKPLRHQKASKKRIIFENILKSCCQLLRFDNNYIILFQKLNFQG
ncbi:hypothetical protein pb186bvf_004989 [Paramecium bursaria]